MTDERRKDYISLPELLAGNVENKLANKYMKETLDGHTEDIKDIKESQVEMTASQKSLDTGFQEFMRFFQKESEKNEGIKNKVDDLEGRFKRIQWFCAGVAAVVSVILTLCGVFAKKIAIILGITL